MDHVCQTTYEGEFTGTISIDVLAGGPSGPDGAVTSNYAADQNGWVESHFLIQWAGNSFSPSPFPGYEVSDYYTFVGNDYSGRDELSNNEIYYLDWETGYRKSYASLERMSWDTSWLSGLTFETRELAPPVQTEFGTTLGINRLLFGDAIYEGAVGSSGFMGIVNLTSLTVRPTELPEPTTLSLFGLALAGLGLVRRRRLTA